MAAVSVIVPTYNRPYTLRRALASIAVQDFTDFEIVVVNDAGEEAGAVAALFDALYFAHPVNKGLAAARNTGIKGSSGKYIAYLDDDDWYYPSHLSTLVDYLEAHPEAGAAYTDAHRTWTATGQQDIPYSQDWDNAEILRRNITPVCCVMHRRECLDVGLFDEELHALEDWDMWIRMSRRYTFRHIKKPTCTFSWATDGSTMTSSKQDDFTRAGARIRSKGYG